MIVSNAPVTGRTLPQRRSVTLTGRLMPGVAVAATFMTAVICVELTTVTEELLTYLGPLTVAPAANPVPVRVTAYVLPRARLEGVMAVRVGAGITEKQVEQDTVV